MLPASANYREKFMGEGQALYTTVTQPARLRLANTKPFNPAGEHVTYWMQASQRVHENPALAYAVELANTHSKPLVVCFGVTAYPSAQQAHFSARATSKCFHKTRMHLDKLLMSLKTGRGI